MLDHVNREVCILHCEALQRYGNGISQSHDRKGQTVESGLMNNSIPFMWSVMKTVATY